MNDYNFFESYTIKQKSNNGPALMILIAFFAVLLLLIGGIIGGKVYLNLKIKDLNNTLNIKENQVILNRLQEKENLESRLTSINNDLAMAPASLDQQNPVNEQLLDNVVKSLPADAQITDIVMTQEGIAISGKAALRSAIAEFKHNLGLVIKAEVIRVDTIVTTPEGVHEFEMIIQYRREPDESK